MARSIYIHFIQPNMYVSYRYSDLLKHLWYEILLNGLLILIAIRILVQSGL